MILYHRSMDPLNRKGICLLADSPQMSGHRGVFPLPNHFKPQTTLFLWLANGEPFYFGTCGLEVWPSPEKALKVLLIPRHDKNRTPIDLDTEQNSTYKLGPASIGRSLLVQDPG